MKLHTSSIYTTGSTWQQAVVLGLKPVTELNNVFWGAGAADRADLPVLASAHAAGLYTDLATAMDVADQLRQLIAVYRTRYGAHVGAACQPH